MKHLTSIIDIERTIADNCLCLFYIKAPDCGVCNVMLDKVGKLADQLRYIVVPSSLTWRNLNTTLTDFLNFQNND